MSLIYSPFIMNALIGIVLGGVTAMIAGALSMLRNVHYLSAEVAHSALGGAAIGALIYSQIGYEPIIFIAATTFSIISSIITGYIVRERGGEAAGLAIGVALAISLSTYSIVIGMLKAELIIKVNSYLLSDILLITYSDLIGMTLISFIGLIVLIAFYKEMLYICFDVEGAEALGLKTKIYDYMAFALIGAAGAVLARAMGALLIYALAILPAASSIEISNNTSKIFIYTFTISLTSGITGLLISLTLNLPTSGTIAATATTIYILIKVARKII